MVLVLVLQHSLDLYIQRNMDILKTTNWFLMATKIKNDISIRRQLSKELIDEVSISHSLPFVLRSGKFHHNFLTKRFARTSKWVVKTYGIADIGGHFEFKIFGEKFKLQKKKVYQNPTKHSKGEAFWNFKKINLERERVYTILNAARRVKKSLLWCRPE